MASKVAAICESVSVARYWGQGAQLSLGAGGDTATVCLNAGDTLCNASSISGNSFVFSPDRFGKQGIALREHGGFVSKGAAD